MESHSHDFWTANFSVRGVCDLVSPYAGYRLGKYDIAFIPPGVSHYMSYPGKYLCCTFKFKSSVTTLSEIIVLPASSQTQGVVSAAEMLIKTMFPKIYPAEGMFVLENDLYQLVAEYLISACFQYVLAAERVEGDPVSVIRDMMLKNGGKPVSAKAIAREMKLSVYKANAMTLRQTGKSIKELADDERLNIGRHYLADPRYYIKEIAELMGFANSFQFNRFFRRLTGTAPSAWRRENI